jgi:hypothetical protein
MARLFDRQIHLHHGKASKPIVFNHTAESSINLRLKKDSQTQEGHYVLLIPNK